MPLETSVSSASTSPSAPNSDGPLTIGKVEAAAIDTMLKSTPSWLIRALGSVALVAITFMLVLSALGLTGAFHAAVDNWAKQFDKSTVTFERAVSKLETIVDRVAKLETVTIVQGNNQVALETRVAKVEEVLAGTPFIMGSPKTATGTRPVAKAKPARRQTTKTSYQTRTSTPPQNQWPFI